MNCPRCHSENPDGKNYCGDCGAALGQQTSGPEAISEDQLQKQIQAALDTRFKDQKVVEVETAQQIAERLVGWVKLLGALTSIPLAILILILGLLGITKIADFFSYVDKAKTSLEGMVGATRTKFESQTKDMELMVKAAKKNVEAYEADFKSITDETRSLREKLTQSEKTFSEKIGHLQGAVEQLQRTEFEKSPDLTPERQKRLDGDISQFRDYMHKLGFTPTKDWIKVKINATGSMNAYYDPAVNTIFISPDFVDDSDVAFREYAHHILLSAGSDRWIPSAGLESGLADYFACSFQDDPKFGEKVVEVFRKLDPERFGEPFLRTMENHRKFTELKNTHTGSEIIDEGEVWGGAFWESRQKMGKSAQGIRLADILLLKTWEGFKPSADIEQARIGFVKGLLEQDKKLTGGRFAADIQEIFKARGLKL
jgi:hypothetical protein